MVDLVLQQPSSGRASYNQGGSDEPQIHGGRRRLEDLVWEYSNAPRILNANKLAWLKVCTAHSASSSSSTSYSSASSPYISSSSSTAYTSDIPRARRETYILFFGAMHAALDGIALFSLMNEVLELLGGSPSRSYSPPPLYSRARSPRASDGQGAPPSTPRSDAELRALLDEEWALRYARGGALETIVKARAEAETWGGDAGDMREAGARGACEAGLLTPSFEARVPPFQSAAAECAAREDYAADQRRFVASIII
jgi:hypothetical protein